MEEGLYGSSAIHKMFTAFGVSLLVPIFGLLTPLQKISLSDSYTFLAIISYVFYLISVIFNVGFFLFGLQARHRIFMQLLQYHIVLDITNFQVRKNVALLSSIAFGFIFVLTGFLSSISWSEYLRSISCVTAFSFAIYEISNFENSIFSLPRFAEIVGVTSLRSFSRVPEGLFFAYVRRLKRPAYEQALRDGTIPVHRATWGSIFESLQLFGAHLCGIRMRCCRLKLWHRQSLMFDYDEFVGFVNGLSDAEARQLSEYSIWPVIEDVPFGGFFPTLVDEEDPEVVRQEEEAKRKKKEEERARKEAARALKAGGTSPASPSQVKDTSTSANPIPLSVPNPLTVLATKDSGSTAAETGIGIAAAVSVRVVGGDAEDDDKESSSRAAPATAAAAAAESVPVTTTSEVASIAAATASATAAAAAAASPEHERAPVAPIDSSGASESDAGSEIAEAPGAVSAAVANPLAAGALALTIAPVSLPSSSPHFPSSPAIDSTSALASSPSSSPDPTSPSVRQLASRRSSDMDAGEIELDEDELAAMCPTDYSDQIPATITEAPFARAVTQHLSDVRERILAPLHEMTFKIMSPALGLIAAIVDIRTDGPDSMGWVAYLALGVYATCVTISVGTYFQSVRLRQYLFSHMLRWYVILDIANNDGLGFVGNRFGLVFFVIMIIAGFASSLSWAAYLSMLSSAMLFMQLSARYSAIEDDMISVPKFFELCTHGDIQKLSVLNEQVVFDYVRKRKMPAYTMHVIQRIPGRSVFRLVMEESLKRAGQVCATKMHPVVKLFLFLFLISLALVCAALAIVVTIILVIIPYTCVCLGSVSFAAQRAITCWTLLEPTDYYAFPDYYLGFDYEEFAQFYNAAPRLKRLRMNRAHRSTQVVKVRGFTVCNLSEVNSPLRGSIPMPEFFPPIGGPNYHDLRKEYLEQETSP